MASEVIALLLWANATLVAGIVIVLALRVPVRRLGGARIAYLLWLIPPAAFFAWLLPVKVITLSAASAGALVGVRDAAEMAVLRPTAAEVLAVWLVGAAAAVAVFALRQRGFWRAAGELSPAPTLGHDVYRGSAAAGPAVAGALRPVIVLPGDFAERFSADEQALVIAHERTHLERRDPIVSAIATAVRAVNWFNPLVHLAARALRMDQELACDAAVLARLDGAKRTYGEAMLKAHAPAYDPAFGCAWRPQAFHTLKERLVMLNRSTSPFGRSAGLSLVVAAAVAASGAVWLMRPAEVIAAPAREEPMSAAEEEAVREAEIDAQEAEIDAREAEIEARQAAKEAMRSARAALATVRREAMLGARQAAQEARAAIAAARMAMKEAEPAIAAAREAIMDVRPAIAAAEKAIREARPAIAAARREAARHARLAMIDARRAQRLEAACQRALARRPSFAFSTEGQLRALEKLVCIPGPVGDRPTLAPTPAPKPTPAPVPQD
jgi:beta-lactamase regulating signal transducer with metallopeptidase domain